MQCYVLIQKPGYLARRYRSLVPKQLTELRDEMLPFPRVECKKQSDQNVTSHSSVTVHVIGEEKISSCLMSIILWTFPNVVV